MGMGCAWAVEQIREQIAECSRELIAGGAGHDLTYFLKTALQEWLEGRSDAEKSKDAAKRTDPAP